MLFILIPLGFFFLTTNSYAAGRGAFAGDSIGARPSIFGESFVAVADDASALRWNPAGLTQLLQYEFTSSHINFFSMGGYVDYTETNSVNEDFIGLAMPGRIAALGISFLNLGVPGMLNSDEAGGITNSFGGYSERTLTLSASKGIRLKGFGLSGGCNVNYYSIGGGSDSSGFGLDGGLLLKTPGIIPEIGIMMRGLFMNTILGGGGLTIPAKTDIAMSFSPWRRVILSGGLSKTSGDPMIQYSTGLELISHELAPLHISLIGGYKVLGRLEEGGLEASSGGLAGGASIRISRYRIDYAYEQHALLGDTHRITIGILQNSLESLHFRKGKQAFERLDDASAVKEFKEVAYLSPRDAENYHIMALTYERMREKEKAIELLNKIKLMNSDYFAEKKLNQLMNDIQEQE